MGDMGMGMGRGMTRGYPPRCGIQELNATLLKQAGKCNTTKSEQKALQ